MNQQTESAQQTVDASLSSESRTYSAYQRDLLEKLERMRRNRSEYGFRPDAEEWVIKAMDRSIYSAYLDCLSAGIGQEGAGILGGEGSELPQQPSNA